jgi:hypothetical protein
MTLISVQANMTTEDLFAAIEQLEPADADAVARRLLHLQAYRKAPHLLEREAELLRVIYQEKRPGFRERYDELIAKRRAFTLLPEEQAELLGLTDDSEEFDAERLIALSELAHLRDTTLQDLMNQLGLKARSVV